MHPLTSLCFLLHFLGRLSLPALPPLLGICLPSLWSPPFLFDATALIFISVVKVQLSVILTLPSLTIWNSGLTALLLVLLAKTVLTYLPTVLLCGTKATLSFSAGPVCSSFSAEACAILHAICWSRQHQQVCHFSSLLLLSDPRFVLTTLSSPPSFLLPQTLWQIW